ncbi:MAG: molybdopterin-dependent oxidoreductase [Micromonosporaceae bacterium]|nr:molybdopterin-dependent oxidoreductase [Micromonosporaceae bacterium]
MVELERVVKSGHSTEQVSQPSRIAAPDEAIGADELQLAARNHGMPLEALHYDITPPGLHYLLTHYDIPVLDAATWRLTVDGKVRRPLVLSLDDLRSRPAVTLPVTLECAGNGRARLNPRPVSQPWLNEAVGTAEWTGTPLASLLAEAGVEPGAVEVVFTGHDHGVERGVEQDYQRGLSFADAAQEEVLLAYQMNGLPLPPQHGFPLRLMAPGWYGMAHVKWLRAITVTDEPFAGFQNARAYRVKNHPDDVGEPVTRIRPRALMAPPGFPDFMSRARVARPGRHLLTGRAWSGLAPVTGVQVSVDGGATWDDADLEPALGRWAWSRWTYQWDAVEPGRHVLLARASDAAGNTQPVDQEWNAQGMANNMAQRVEVHVS